MRKHDIEPIDKIFGVTLAILIFFLIFLICTALFGCAPKKAAHEQSARTIVIKDTVERVKYITLATSMESRDSVHERENITQDYRFGRTDTVLRLRVDTIRKSIERVRYVYRDKERAQSEERRDSAAVASIRSDTLRMRAAVTTERGQTWTERIRSEIGGLGIALILFALVFVIEKFRR